jgi:membrane protein
MVRVQRESRISLAASGAAFWLVLAAFPAAIAAVNIIGLVVDQEEIAARIADLAATGGDSLGRVFSDQLLQVAAPSPGTFLVDSLLVLVALWSVSRAMRYLLDALRSADGLPRRDLAWHLAVSMITGLVAVLVLGFIAYVVSFLAGGAVVLLDIIGFALAVLLVTGLHWAALGRQFHLRLALPGIALSAAGMIVVTLGFRVYVLVAGDMRAIYGALGGIVLIMVATWVVVYVILVGGVLNARIAARGGDQG